MWETSPCCHIRTEEDGHHATDLESEIQPMSSPCCQICRRSRVRDDEDWGCVAASGRADGGVESGRGSRQIAMAAADRTLHKGSGCYLRCRRC
ncbi:hypothetical protein ACLOJK_022640 [Asimina triloba]